MRLAATAAGAILLLAGVSCGGGATNRDALPEKLTRIVLEPTSPGTEEQLDVAIGIMRARLERLGVDSADIRRDGGRIAVILPGNVDRVLPIVMRRGRLEFFDLQGDLVPDISVDIRGFPVPRRRPPRLRLKTIVITCGERERYCPGVNAELTGTYYYLFRYDPDNLKHPVPELTGDDIELKGTRQDFGTQGAESGQPLVLIQFTSSGAKEFHELTRTLAERGQFRFNQSGGAGDPELYSQQLAIVLDREMKSAPSVSFRDNPDGIPGGNGAQIAGIGSLKEAKDLEIVLQTGALPLEFRVLSQEERRIK